MEIFIHPVFKSLVHYSYPRGLGKLKQFEQITRETETWTGPGSPRGQEHVHGHGQGVDARRPTSQSFPLKHQVSEIYD